jgi:hypothetical protein
MKSQQRSHFVWSVFNHVTVCGLWFVRNKLVVYTRGERRGVTCLRCQQILEKESRSK